MTLETTWIPCSVCQTPIEILPVAGIITGICGHCTDIITAQREAEVEAANREGRWQKLVEPFKEYQDTVFDRLPCQESSSRACRWDFGRTGLELVGPTGTGKTRTLFLILRRQYAANHSIRILGPGDFASRCVGYDTSELERSLRAVDILALDDFDKVPLAPIADGKFFGVIEARCAKRLPTLLTHESSDGIARWRSGDALSRRIRDPYLFTRIQFI